MSQYEKEVAQRESDRNSAEDAYFEARPQIDCIDRRRVFEAGFDRAWELQQKRLQALQAKVDSLMLEFCPEEMTPEQGVDWAAHQVPAK